MVFEAEGNVEHSKQYSQSPFYSETSEHAQWLVREIAAQAQCQSNMKVLDIGCGTGTFAKLFIAESGVDPEGVMGIEPDPSRAEEARERGDIR